MPTRILGIESSCDETAAAVVVNGREILSSVVSSQLDIHRKYGGVVPELASREHLRQIVPVVREALLQAGLKFTDLDAVGVTQGPGLVGSLLVGVTYGKVLATELGKPLVPVNHLEGHVHAVFLEAHLGGKMPELPAICLIVSGGHTLLYHVESAAGNGDASKRGFQFRRLGGTRDDAAGEAYDKVARLIALGYPGGPIIDQLARKVAESGANFHEKDGLNFNPVKIKGNPFDFSFSGVKTAVLYYVRSHPEFVEEIENRKKALDEGRSKVADLLPLCSPRTLSLISKFQAAVVRDLVTRTLEAAAETNSRTILVSGGVAANSELRDSFTSKTAGRAVSVFFPSRALSTDNAAMIAAAAYPHLLVGDLASPDLNAEPNLRLA
ncbi:MAG TPA: tRNA (adenosine(37)-N6)-threonylcarbamoyltransferase complex transferase subunit TsaD [Candidatus Acidoferrales bacterium]|jgi:N6-L-threonylcarbamoyladenine synthase